MLYVYNLFNVFEGNGSMKANHLKSRKNSKSNKKTNHVKKGILSPLPDPQEALKQYSKPADFGDK